LLAGVGTNRLLINDGSGMFIDETNRLFLQLPGLSSAVVACDADAKNGPDLFVVGAGTGQHLRRAAVAQHQIGGGLSERLRNAQSGSYQPAIVLRLLQSSA
jgi:hypothetical protein